MPRVRAVRLLTSVLGMVLIAIVLAGAGVAWQVRRGALPPFTAELPVWPTIVLTLRNGPQSVCHPYQFCPRQIGLYVGLSVWVTRRVGGGREPGQRLLFLPTLSQRTGAQRWMK